jgi:hypothetical protein
MNDRSARNIALKTYWNTGLLACTLIDAHVISVGAKFCRALNNIG